MSEEPTLVTRRHFDYIEARTTREDDFLRELKEAAAAAGLPSIAISPAQAALLQILLVLRDAREVVEVGTLGGYSAIAMARALPEGGRVRTIEINPEYADFARSWIAKSDVAGRVEVVTGAGAQVLPELEAESADACFLDADKGSYGLYLEECLRILRPGGLVTADNAFAFGQLFDESPTDPEAAGVRAFNDLVPKIPGLAAVIVPLGDGLWLGVKHRRTVPGTFVRRSDASR